MKKMKFFLVISLSIFILLIIYYQIGNKDILTWYKKNRSILVETFIFNKPYTREDIFNANFELRTISGIETHLGGDHVLQYPNRKSFYIDLIQFEYWFLTNKHSLTSRQIDSIKSFILVDTEHIKSIDPTNQGF